jgi:hypothetical protein
MRLGVGPSPRFVEDHFPTSGAVPPSDLVGREDAVADIATRLRLGNNLIITGPRRTGKSSVAAAVAETLETAEVVVVPVEFVFTTTLEGFCRSLFDACGHAAAGAGSWWDQLALAARNAGLAARLRVRLGSLMEIGLAMTGDQPDRRLESALSLPVRLAERLRTRVVVVMDEFQDAGKLHADFYRVLRRTVAGGGRVSHLFLGSRATLLRNLFVRPNEPLYRTATEYDLPDAGLDAWHAYLAGKFAAVGVSTTAAALRHLLVRTGGHPQDTMMLAADAYAMLCREDRDTLTADDVSVSGDRLLKSLSLAFEAEWSDLSGDRGARIALPRIARAEPVHHGLSPAENKAATTALQRLVREGLVRRAGRGRYMLREPLFGEWLRINMRG